MHRPVLVTPPSTLPVTLAEAKAHLRVNALGSDGNLLANEDDALIEGLIRAATDHLDGWTGILGRCLVEQTWRQDYDAFAHCLPLPLGPLIQIDSVKWTGRDGVQHTLAQQDYAAVVDGGGRAAVRMADGFSVPGDLASSGAVSVTFRAGYPTIDNKSTVPAALKQALLLLVGAWYENREETVIGVSVAALPPSVAFAALIRPYRSLRV
ncbi:head-tail connector protein [Chelativorans oligotrophicus]|uniref:head-tail connector protein n=1 Tax=Chelativorans oligotrophicus TaxID=449974 RepID=UPI00140DED47|nr:head-tail connector protein [Chelativorans oligotrophicus]